MPLPLARSAIIPLSGKRPDINLIAMTEQDWREQLLQEGFQNIRTHTDSPDTVYKEHTHPTTNPHIVLAGHLRLFIDGKTILLNPGDRYDILAGVKHSSEIGADGCTFIIGEK